MALDLNKLYQSLAQGGGYVSSVGSSGLAGYSGQQGPSKPGYVQGTANTIPASQQAANKRSASTNLQQAIQAGQGQVLGASTGSSGSGGDSRLAELAKTGRNPVQESEYQSLLQQAPQQPQIDFDALIRPALESLDAYISPLQQEAQGTIQGIESQKSSQLAKSQADIAAQTGTLEGARTSQQGLAENAADEARRQYAEIQQGLQSRYGGTTGTGQFASEIAGRQTLQNIGKIREGLSQAMLEIDNKRQQVQEIGRISAIDIEDKARDQINQAKSNLDLQLADIRRQKGELQSRKAEMAAQAMQVYQQQVNQVNAQNAAFKQSLYQQQLAAENQLKEAASRAKQTAESFSLYNFSDISGQNTPVRVGNRGTVQSLGGGQAPNIAGGQLFDIGVRPQAAEEDPIEKLLRQQAGG